MKKYFSFLIAVTATTFIHAQTNFTGRWAEPALEMVSGIQYANAVPEQIIVTQTKDSITLTSTSGETKSSRTIALNGKKSVRLAASSKRTITTSAIWNAAKNTITFVTIYSYADKPAEAEYTNTEIWEMGDDGTTLVITKTSDAAVTDDWTIKATYHTGE